MNKYDNPYKEGTIEHSFWEENKDEWGQGTKEYFIKKEEKKRKVDEYFKKSARDRKVTQIYAKGCSWIIYGFILYILIGLFITNY